MEPKSRLVRLINHRVDPSAHRRLYAAADGQAAVEFALTATVLLLLLFGVIQLAIVGDALLAVNQYAYSAVRYASINAGTCASQPCSTSSLGSQIKALPKSPFIDDSGLATPTVSPGSVSSGNQISVTITYNLVTGQKLFLQSLFGTTLFPTTSVTSTESMLVE
jgi:Flp pilus assembly protein TadG